jgi:beta-lactamase regulating signal transducer with metallopeptidase domain
MLAPFIESALRSLILALIVWAGLRIFRVHSVVAQRTAWSAVLVCSLLMPFVLPFAAQWRPLSFATIPAPASLIHVQSAFATRQSAMAQRGTPSIVSNHTLTIASRGHRRTIESAPTINAPASARAATPPAESSLELESATQAPARVQFSIVDWALLAYLLIAASLLGRLLFGIAAALRLWYSSTPITLGDDAHFGANLNVRTSHKISTPVTIGTGVVLPAGYAGWTEEKLRIVLAHERSHVSQYDFHLQILASLYAAVAWFSPLGWWLKHKLSDLGEAISDRSGLDVTSNRSAYAQVLLEFAATPRPTLIGVPMARPSSISRRIERLLNDNYARLAFSDGTKARLAVLVLPVLLFAGAAVVRVQAAAQSEQAPPAAGVVAPVAPAPPTASRLAAPPAPPADSTMAAPPAPPTAAQLDAPSISPADMVPPAPNEVAFAVPPAPPEPRAEGKDSSAKWEGAFDRALSISGKVELSVSTGSGTITLTRGSSGQVHVHGVVKVYRDGDTSRAQQLAANPPIEQDGNTIRIGVQHENLQNISIDYVIEAPADSALNAATGSGDIGDTGVGQDAKLTTGSGNIIATGLENGFNIMTGSGDATVDGDGQGEAKVQTGSGNIDVKGVHGALKAQTGSGDIKAAGTPSAEWKLQTGSGEIELTTGNAPMNLDASTGSGNVTTDQPVSMKLSSDEEHHHLRAQLNGGGPEVRAETGSGDIHIH